MKMYTHNDNSSDLWVKYTGDKLFHFSLHCTHKTFLVSYDQDMCRNTHWYCCVARVIFYESPL